MLFQAKLESEDQELFSIIIQVFCYTQYGGIEVNRHLSRETNMRRNYSSRNIWSGILFGIGLVAFLDEAVFHQLLHWHHFYDRSTTEIGLVSDGLFHAFSWLKDKPSLGDRDSPSGNHCGKASSFDIRIMDSGKYFAKYFFTLICKSGSYHPES